MAKILFSALVTDIRGSIGGTTIQGSGNNAIIRNKPHNGKSVNALTSARKGNASYLAGKWKGLTATNVAAFNSMRAAYVTTDKFGNTHMPSAFNLFMSMNLRALAIGSTLLLTPGIPPAFLTGQTAFALQYSSGLLYLDWYNGLGDPNYCMVYASAPYSPNRVNPPSGYKLIRVCAPSSGIAQNLTTDYNAVFGSIVVGAQIAVKVVLFSLTTGAASAATFLYIVP